MKLATEFIPLNDGTQICAPSNITLMTSYVLREQGDWFEDEIHFIRKFIKPGMVSLDIGANYGLYATAIAKHMGPKGRLWCFEPTPNTADALRATFKKNKYRGKVKVVEAGLSNQDGAATFFMSPNAELNTLEPAGETFLQEQTIKLLTLDGYVRDAGLLKADFVKLDAEGEEVRIVEGGQIFFTEFSPLVMFELMHVDRVNEDLLRKFSELGYCFYYLVPGLNTLAPFEEDVAVDRYLLNLFALKADRVEEFKAAGIIVDNTEQSEELYAGITEDYATNKVVARLPEVLSMPESETKLAKILSLLLLARNTKLTKQERFDALRTAYQEQVQDMAIEQASPELLASAARVSLDLGERDRAVSLLEAFVQKYLVSGKLPTIEHIYYPVSRAYDVHPLVYPDDTNQSFCVMMIEEYIRKAHRSGYFSGGALVPCFAALKRFGSLSKEMAIREKISQARDVAMRAK